MRIIFLLFLLFASELCVADTKSPVKGVIVTYEGSEVCYKLDDVPTVRYVTVDGSKCLALYLKNEDEPVLCEPISDEKSLVIAYGEYYSSSDVDTPTQVTPQVNGVIVTYEGSEVCYKLDDVPTVRYVTVDGAKCLALYLRNEDEPVLCEPISDKKSLVITYGEYCSSADVETGVDNTTNHVTIREINGKKYIYGGRLVIIRKDGKKFDISGVEIK